MGRVILLAILAVLVAIPLYFLFLQSPPPLPKVDLNEWWGPEQLRTKQDISIRPFTVKFSPTLITDLQDRLKHRHPLTPPLEGIAFEYGFNSKQLEGWLKYWAAEYPFSEREKFFNKFPQFKTNIQGLDIHFIRVKPDPKESAGKKVYPLLLLHGWPGSVREFYEAIPLLTAASKDRDFVLEVIVPSLPGYGFSSAAVRPGLGADKMAVVFRNLMERLGYKKYFIQGGDWGSFITSIMATLFPKEILGYHTNMAFLMTTSTSILRMIGAIYPPLVVSSEVQDRMYPLSTNYAYLLEETGYMHIQATKPDTVGVALTDSPAGLAAYILEKFSTWTNKEYRTLNDGGLSKRFTKEKLIDNLMAYWSTNSITTSMRLYSESFSPRLLSLKLDDIPSPVPTWLIQAKHELAYTPAWMMRWKFPNLINAVDLDDGGHFLAFELPDVFAKDVLKAIEEFISWHAKNQKTEL